MGEIFNVIWSGYVDQFGGNKTAIYTPELEGMEYMELMMPDDKGR